MAAVESQMLALGTVAPAFSLPDPDGGLHALTPGADAYLVMFISNHCPFVVHVADELGRLGRDYADRAVQIIAIGSNNIETHPADAPDKMRQKSQAWGFTFPYVFDESQAVAQAYRAACTPDFFLFDSEQKLVYRGQLDDSRPGNGRAVDGKDLRAAIDAVLAGRAPSPEQKPSIGCSIKWKPGNAPG